MKKIGEGYYYHVYDLGNGRVLKKQKSQLRMFFYIMIARRFHPNFLKEFKNAIENTKTTKSLYIRLQQQCLDMKLLGNPVFRNGIEYEQDKVQIIRPLLQTVSVNQVKQIIDDFIVLIHKLWEYGISDEVYNFTINNGLVTGGAVALIDFNEVTFDKEKVEQSIKKSIWLRRWSYNHLNPEMRRYYKEQMAKELTLERLNELWKVKVLY